MHDSTRRVFVLSGLATFLAGCASSRTSSLPEPWEGARAAGVARPQPDPGLAASAPVAARPAPAASNSGVMAGVLPRSRWATGAEIPSRMDPMLPPRRVTIHHDALTSQGFTSTSERDAMAYINRIRASHQTKGWGDVGYHFLIDPAGRVWEGRRLKFQGAHVKDQNEHNVGIVCLGNFERHSPTAAQINALVQHVNRVTAAYRIPPSAIRTHRELAQTLCPGRSLQARILDLRNRRAFA